jgi:hypothetical protein
MGSRINTLIEGLDGAILGIARDKQYEKPFSLLTNPPYNKVEMVANQTSTVLAMAVSGSGPLEISQLACKRTGACLAQLIVEDGQTQRVLMNVQQHIDNIFGDGGRPYYLPETLIVDELRALNAAFLDISGSANAVWPVAHAARYLQIQNDPRLVMMRRRMESRQYLSLPYFYGLDNTFKTLSAGGTANEVITIANDHHFEIHTIQIQSSDSFKLNIVDVAQKESIISGPSGVDYEVEYSLISGNGQYPFKLHEPRMIFAGQKLVVSMTELSGKSNTVYLTLGGRAIATKMWK